MPLRNPFRKSIISDTFSTTNNGNNVANSHDGFTRPTLVGAGPLRKGNSNFEGDNVKIVSGSRSPSMRAGRNSDEVDEYQMSVVSDNGVYLPPSPTEEKGFWSWSSTSSAASSNNHHHHHHRSTLNNDEPFTISRESFDSYRRSFDVSAKSPISQSARPPRQSLDSSFSSSSSVHSRPAQWQQQQRPRPSLADRSPLDSTFSSLSTSSSVSEREEQQYQQQQQGGYSRPSALQEPEEAEAFEDVGLGDDSGSGTSGGNKQRKKGLWARFGETDNGGGNGIGIGIGSFHMLGRKTRAGPEQGQLRAAEQYQHHQGSEMRVMAKGVRETREKEGEEEA